MHRSRAMKVAAATSISRMRRKRPYKGVNCARRRRRQQFFSVHGGSWRGTVKLRRGARASLRHSSCHSTKDDMVPDLQPGSTTTRTEGDVVRMCDQVQVTTMRFPDRATLSAPKGDRLIHKMRPSGAAPTSPPEGVLRHMRHQELWRAVGTHYGPTRIYGPTAMPSEGRHSRHSGASTADNAAGPRQYQ